MKNIPGFNAASGFRFGSIGDGVGDGSWVGDIRVVSRLGGGVGRWVGDGLAITVVGMREAVSVPV